MIVKFDLPTITLRCGVCLASTGAVELRRDGCVASVECACAIPAFELLFTSPKHREPLTILPLELAARKVGG